MLTFLCALPAEASLASARAQGAEAVRVKQRQARLLESIFRNTVHSFAEGMVLEDAPDYQDNARKHPLRNNH